MKKGMKIGLVILIIVLVVIAGLLVVNRNNMNTAKRSDSKVENKVTGDSKTLVLYFSWGGTTEKLAKEIADYTDGDIERIVETNTYTSDYNEMTKIAQKEQQDKARPKYNKLNANIKDYDTIFVGYPIWWMDMPMIMYTLFENEDFSGKTVIPFITSYSSGESGTTKEIQDMLKNSTVKNALHIYDSDMNNYKSTTDKFLNKLGYSK